MKKVFDFISSTEFIRLLNSVSLAGFVLLFETVFNRLVLKSNLLTTIDIILFVVMMLSSFCYLISSIRAYRKHQKDDGGKDDPMISP